jgi:hypothetical protein
LMNKPEIGFFLVSKKTTSGHFTSWFEASGILK